MSRAEDVLDELSNGISFLRQEGQEDEDLNVKCDSVSTMNNNYAFMKLKTVDGEFLVQVIRVGDKN